MGLPTLTRGVGWRDDMMLASLWTVDSGVALTSDGDIGTLSGTTSTNGASQTVPGSLSTNTYPKLYCRAASADSTVRTLDILVSYTSGSDTFTMTGLGSAFPTPFTFTLAGGKTISSIKFQNQSASGNLLVDFVFLFKEVLTFPTVLTPIGFNKQRLLVELPILGREGGILQDLGSLSPEYTFTGSLITTTSPNNYTADQWWQILTGVMLETGTVQADGNPTWQWLTTDQIQAKAILKNYQPREVMGRTQYWDYSVLFKQFDVIGENTSNLLGVTY
jgi:hypothetical protein